jgi:hypothetical protein
VKTTVPAQPDASAATVHADRIREIWRLHREIEKLRKAERAAQKRRIAEFVGALAGVPAAEVAKRL